MNKKTTTILFLVLLALIMVGSIPAVISAFRTRREMHSGRIEPPSGTVDTADETDDSSDVYSEAVTTSAPESVTETSAPASSATATSAAPAVPSSSAVKSSAPARTSSAASSAPAAKPSGGSSPFNQEKGDFVTVDKSYFDDALFIGDSRTDDLYQYGTLNNATFYASVGMSVYNIHKKPATDGGVKGIAFSEFIKSRKFGKVYIMLGFNEAGYAVKSTSKKMQELIDEVRQAQPDALIFIESNLYVTKHTSETDKYEHNDEISAVNAMLATLADGEKIFYIDVNPQFCDEEGNLKKEYTGDGTHMYGKYYKNWCEWLMTRGVEPSAE